MAGPRENLFAAIQTRLESIKISNGYSVSVGRVFRGAEWTSDQIDDSEMPALLVLETLAGDTLTPHEIAGYEWFLPILIAGIIRYGETDLKKPTRHTQLNALINDTWKALLVDPTFGNTCKDSILQGGPAMVDPERGEGLFNLSMRCHLVMQGADL